ncbi:hypothetical protein ADK58_16010 [Streptomyces sp. XY152]|nr:hypothetical protein ADK58_16010 [Streptomyces sp. XY152]
MLTPVLVDVGFVDVADQVGRHVSGAVTSPRMPALLTRTSRWPARAQRLDRRADRRVVGHVQLDEAGAEPVGGLASVPGVPGSDPHRLARPDEAAGDLVAEGPCCRR